MCGRFALDISPDQLIAMFGLAKGVDFSPHYNIAPSASVPVIRQSPEGERVADLLRWGLIPHWAKDPSIGNKLNNARSESVTEKPSFRNAYKRRRCLVPASGYYEWQTVPGERKQPWYIRLKSGEPLAMGGLWESWTSPEGEIVRTFCVMTTGPNEVMKPIHDRMPVIIGARDWTTWLDMQREGDHSLSILLAPFAADAMEAWPVSRKVSSAREEGAELIEHLT